MTRRHRFGLLLSAIGGLLLAAPAAIAAPGQERCTAQIEFGKKYHFTTYQAGRIHQAGYVQFQAKHFGKWHKVKLVTDRPKTTRWFWGFFDEHRVTFKRKRPAERWTAWRKFCKGSLLEGTVKQGGKQTLTFTIDTSRVRP